MIAVASKRWDSRNRTGTRPCSAGTVRGAAKPLAF
jgi:hypothetical protein